MIRSLELSALPHSLGREDRRCNWRLSMSMWWSLHKNPQSTSLDSFQVDGQLEVLGGWCSQRGGGRKLSLLSHTPGPVYLFPLVVHLHPFSYDKLVTISVPQTSVSCSGKLWNTGRGSWELWFIAQSIRSRGDNLRLAVGTKVEGVLWYGALHLKGMVLPPRRQCQNWTDL